MTCTDFLSSCRVSRHAKIRQSQRGVPDIALELLVKFGSSESSFDGTERLYFSERDWKRVKQYFGAWMPNKSGKLRDLYLILAADGTILTVAHKY